MNLNSPVLPIELTISSLNLTLPIFSEEITNSRWPVSDRGVIYLKSSPLPGQTGNSIIYGHNWASLLGSLHKLKPGENIEIKLSNNRVIKYRIELLGTVSRDQTHILENTSDSRLTLYTCTGFLDSKRLVAIAKTI